MSKSIRQLIREKGLIRIMEAHDGLTGLLVEKTTAECNGEKREFDGMWVSSLCDSTRKGKPDIELVDFSSRLQTLEEIMDVTTKPIILDGDTGGLAEHLVFNVKTLERIGISALIIEDKIGLKKNSLFGTDVVQTQDDIEHFCHKISECKRVLHSDFMVIARIESLILKQGMEDALKRADAYVKAGADGIMIHSREKSPAEIVEFVKKFRIGNKDIPIVVVPSSFNSITETELKEIGVNVVIYANQFIRAAFPAMKKTAELILANERAQEVDSICMPIKEILTLISDTVPSAK